jgi:hypothetical protein
MASEFHCDRAANPCSTAGDDDAATPERMCGRKRRDLRLRDVLEEKVDDLFYLDSRERNGRD